MVRNLMLAVVLLLVITFTAGESQAFGKKIFGQNTTCSQGSCGLKASVGCTGQSCQTAKVYNSGTCGTNAVANTVVNGITFGSTSPNSYVTGNAEYLNMHYSFSAPSTYAAAATSSPTTASQTATINGKNVTLTQVGTTSTGQPIYTVTTPLPMPAAPTSSK